MINSGARILAQQQARGDAIGASGPRLTVVPARRIPAPQAPPPAALKQPALSSQEGQQHLQAAQPQAPRAAAPAHHTPTKPHAQHGQACSERTCDCSSWRNLALLLLGVLLGVLLLGLILILFSYHRRLRVLEARAAQPLQQPQLPYHHPPSGFAFYHPSVPRPGVTPPSTTTSNTSLASSSSSGSAALPPVAAAWSPLR